MPVTSKIEDKPDLKKTAVIAGGGRLPSDLAATLKARGVPLHVVILNGEVENPQAFSDYPHSVVELEAAGGLLPFLRKKKVERVVFAGTVNRRPKIWHLRPVLPILKLLPKLAAALGKGDDALLRAVVSHVEANGIEVVGAHEIMPDLLIPAGVHTRVAPGPRDNSDIDAALEAALAIGNLDIGQAAVAIGGRAIALEGIEGTDGLLERVVGLRNHGRLAGKSGGVLVKSVKPGQEWRTDLPGIGIRTVEGAASAGLNGIAVVADSTLALGFRELIERADELGLFVVGIPHGEKQ